MTLSDIIAGEEKTTLSFHDYIQVIPENRFRYTQDILQKISEAEANDDYWLLETLLSIASHDGLNKDDTRVLIHLLSQRWHHSHEDIAMMLEEIKDPSSVDSLYKRALDIPDYDDGRSMVKKCIWALVSINTDESWEKIKAIKEELNDPIVDSVINPYIDKKSRL